MTDLIIRTEQLQLNHKDINLTLDIKSLWGLDSESTDTYLKIDEVTKAYGKEVKDFFTRSNKLGLTNIEYINALIRRRNSTKGSCERLRINSQSPENRHQSLKKVEGAECLTNFEDRDLGLYYIPNENDRDKSSILPTKKISNYYVGDVRYNKYQDSYVLYRLDGRSKDMKASVKGTYIHSDLVLTYLRWLNADLAVEVDMSIKDIVRDYYNLKQDRISTKNLYHKLIEASDKYFQEHQAQWADLVNSRLMDMVNMKALGMKAKAFRAKHDIQFDEATRDYLSDKELVLIEEYQDILAGLIRYAKIKDFNTLQAAFDEEVN